MFENAGRKIKGFAKFLFVINLLGGFAGGIYYAIDAKMTHDVIYAMVAFLIVFFVSIILALFVSYLLSGFGELICQITAIAENTKKPSPKSATASSNRVVIDERVEPEEQDIDEG